MIYRKKQIVIEAVQWDCSPKTLRWMHENNFNGHNYDEKFTDIPMIVDDLIIHNANGNLKVHNGDWIIKGIEGEIYACSDSVFKKTYDKIDAPSQFYITLDILLFYVAEVLGLNCDRSQDGPLVWKFTHDLLGHLINAYVSFYKEYKLLNELKGKHESR